MTLSPEGKALLKRMLSSRRFFDTYVSEIVLTKPGYVDGEHIHKISHRIQSFLEEDTVHRGLIITTPPRHMKSTICSECLPAWVISNNPQAEVMIASYNQSQARKMCRSCRQRFDEDWHARVYPRQTFVVDTADEFMLQGKLNGRPNLIAAGVGAGLTGSGADLLIIDDPVKDSEEASSPLIRDKIYDWYRSVALTRLSPKGKVIIVMTRWSTDDIVGRVLNDNPDEWDVLHLPAIDDGKALWPERFPLEELLSRKAILGSRVFEALYQGHPVPAEGGLIRREWIRYADKPFPQSARRVRAWDLAASSGRGDWTAGCLMAMQNGQYIIEDVVAIQGSPYEVQTLVRQTAERDGRSVAIRMEQEPGSSGVANIDNYARNVLRGYDFRPIKPTGPKEVRASAMAAAMENGNLMMLRGTWNRQTEDNLLSFPYGEHDDITDAVAYAFNELALSGASTFVGFL